MSTRYVHDSHAQEHLRRVQTVTDAALAHLTVETLLEELLIRIRELLRADTAAVLLLDEKHGELVATAAKGIEEEVEQGIRLPVGGGFAGKIAASGKPVVLEEVDHERVLNPLLLKRGIRSMLGVPLIVSGSTIGVLHVGTLQPRKFTPEDIELLQLVADRVALAINLRRDHDQRLIAGRLQRSLLPDRLPKVEGIEIAGHYHPADAGMVGGDWYDVFALKSNSLCVVVGDIAGRGISAAIEMARLRNAVRAIALLEEAPSVVLSRLNEFLLHFDSEVVATMVVGVVDANGTLRYANAGHLPPLVLNRHGQASIVDEPAEPPIGAFDSSSYRERTLALEPESTLILYTDGLVERRGRSLEEGLEALRRAAESPWTNLGMLCARLLESDQTEPGLADDIALLALSFTREAGNEIHRTYEADPRILASLRGSLRRWLAGHSEDLQLRQDILVAVGEAAANSIEHAHGPGRGVVQIDGRARDGMIEITVRDRGAWREPRGRDRGLGRSLMSSLMDEVRFHTDERGTLVTLRKQVR
ncbi:MAG TPA: SpoIIE family protein phosphatase [Actinomycetota bacterium]|nr:SpoIIE family protein phosphatase [Actinomycetota bacterium]